MAKDGLTIGDLADRTGLAVSAIRFYETHGIVHPVRNAGGHRRYGRHDLRRLSFAMVAQRLGFPLARIAEEMAHLPAHKAPGKQDWARVSRNIRDEIEEKISDLNRLRDKLDGCIGCGCLSMENCALYNPDDVMSKRGTGAVLLARD